MHLGGTRTKTVSKMVNPCLGPLRSQKILSLWLLSLISVSICVLLLTWYKPAFSVSQFTWQNIIPPATLSSCSPLWENSQVFPEPVSPNSPGLLALLGSGACSWAVVGSHSLDITSRSLSAMTWWPWGRWHPESCPMTFAQFKMTGRPRVTWQVSRAIKT